MVEIKTKRICNFCGSEVRTDDTYNHGACIINLTFTKCYNYDYNERTSKTESVDICNDCLMELRYCLSSSSNERLKSCFK